MVWMKRIFVFLLVNILVMTTISILLKVLGIQPYLTANGINYESLLAFCLVWGMGGAFISLALSKVMAKWTMGVQIITPDVRDTNLQSLVQRVHQLSQSAGLTKMPEVGIYNSPEINAFATGPTKRNSLVAVSSGLLNNMNRKEVDGVLAHEVAHIANGDMVTMTLIQGVVNAFAMFLARAIAFAVSQAAGGRSDSDDIRGFSSLTYFAVQIVLEIIFMILGSMVVAAFSRWREYRADRGGALLSSREHMIAALQALQRTYGSVDGAEQASVQTLKISSKGSGIFKLFSTHPPLEDRIARLREQV